MNSILWVWGNKAQLQNMQKAHSSGAVWESRWPSWAVRPNESSGFRGHKELLNHASALVSTCPQYVNWHPRTLSNTTYHAKSLLHLFFIFFGTEHFCWLQQHCPVCFTKEKRGVRGWRGLQEPHAIPAQNQTESSMYKNNNNLNNNNSTYCTLTLEHICYKHHKWHMIQMGVFTLMNSYFVT